MTAAEAGPEICVQSHTIILPSGSLDKLPSSKRLSVGKVITWSGPAFEMGARQSGQVNSFWQESRNNPVNKKSAHNFIIDFMIANCSRWAIRKYTSQFTVL